MDPVITQTGLYLIPVLYMVCFGGLAYTLASALREGSRSYADVYAVDAAREFEDLFLFIPPKRIADFARVASVLSFLLLFFLFGNFESRSGMTSGGFFGILGAVIALNAPRLILRILKRRRLERFNEQLVEALLSMSNALKAGFSILQSCESVVREGRNPIAQEFGLFLQQTRVGMRFEDAMEALEQRVGSEDLTLMVVAIETARQTGGNLTEVFERIAATIRERMRIEGRIRTLTAQGRLQGVIAGATPLLLALAMSALDPGMMHSFFSSPIGMGTLSAILVLELIGAFVIRKIVAIDV